MGLTVLKAHTITDHAPALNTVQTVTANTLENHMHERNPCAIQSGNLDQSWISLNIRICLLLSRNVRREVKLQFFRIYNVLLFRLKQGNSKLPDTLTTP